MPGEIEPTFGAETYRDLWHGAIAAEKSGGADRSSGERSLEHCLQVGAPANVAVTDDEDSSRLISSRDAPQDAPMTTFVE